MTLNSRISIFSSLLSLGMNGPEYDLRASLSSKRQSVTQMCTMDLRRVPWISGVYQGSQACIKELVRHASIKELVRHASTRELRPVPGS